jgi:hypothetical protein
MAQPLLPQTSRETHPSLPEEFIDSLILSPECPMCTEGYDSVEHIAARIPGCNHCLGKSCLLKLRRSKGDNTRKCPLCRTELWRQYDSDDEDAELHFIQRLWSTLCAIPNEEIPGDSTFETILANLRYSRIRWLSQLDILPCLLFACRVMHSAIRLDDTLSLKSLVLLRDATYYYYYHYYILFLNNHDTLSWEYSARAIEELSL